MSCGHGTQVLTTITSPTIAVGCCDSSVLFLGNPTVFPWHPAEVEVLGPGSPPPPPPPPNSILYLDWAVTMGEAVTTLTSPPLTIGLGTTRTLTPPPSGGGSTKTTPTGTGPGGTPNTEPPSGPGGGGGPPGNQGGSKTGTIPTTGGGGVPNEPPITTSFTPTNGTSTGVPGFGVP